MTAPINLPSLSAVKAPPARFGGPFSTIGTEVLAFLERRREQEEAARQRAMEQSLLALRERGVAATERGVDLEQARLDASEAERGRQARQAAARTASIGQQVQAVEQDLIKILDGDTLAPLPEGIAPEEALVVRQRQLKRLEDLQDAAARDAAALKRTRAGRAEPRTLTEEERRRRDSIKDRAITRLQAGEEPVVILQDLLAQEDLQNIPAHEFRGALNEAMDELEARRTALDRTLAAAGLRLPNAEQGLYTPEQVGGLQAPRAGQGDVRQQAPPNQQEIIADAVTKSVLAELGISDFTQLTPEQHQRVVAIIQQRLAMRRQQ